MFLYRVKYNESESDIQNNDLVYKTHQKYQNTLDFSKFFEKFKNPYSSEIPISKWSAFYGDFYGPPLAGLKF